MSTRKLVVVALAAGAVVAASGTASAATRPSNVHHLTYQMAHRMVDRNTVIVQTADWADANAEVIFPLGTGNPAVEGSYVRSPVYRFHRDLRVTFHIPAGSARTLYEVVVETKTAGAGRPCGFGWVADHGV